MITNNKVSQRLRNTLRGFNALTMAI